MKNFIFISPNFPVNYWMFCRGLRDNGLRVLGIGDQPYDDLSWELKDTLTEYYKVDDLKEYDSVYRAVAFYIFKYGRIDWIESNNEYWLEQDAKLRTDFNIPSGFHTKDLPRIRYKSHMKTYYQKAGIPTARYHMVDTLSGCRQFIREVGYPVVVKPDNGVGASLTWCIENAAQLRQFFKEKPQDISFIMEEFIFAEINSYDAIIDSHGEPLFETGNITPVSIMDIVNKKLDSLYYIVKTLAPSTRAAGRACVKSFGVKSRFVHFEFFRLLKDQKGLGKAGDLVALEVNMRPSGGFTPDMINFASETDVYKIWADMIAFDSTTTAVGDAAFCVFVGRRDGVDYAMSEDAVRAKYGNYLRMDTRMPDVLSEAMGNHIFIARFENKQKMNGFVRAVTRRIN